ncbi:hypothetical protein MLD38_011801 [Melastoma candidum]|uniref:Uncharacterized protein n=1 Tax=Melastoma candidum TaxID=119954 RepID=A0ACB9R476_9MYRT|nr:hypothetical protein MLD38_011801 [Melastoma candidum]
MEKQNNESLASQNEKTGDSAKEVRKRERAIRRRFEFEDREDVNRQADAFISNFRNQLRIQREDSIKQFHEMIARGV